MIGGTRTVVLFLKHEEPGDDFEEGWYILRLEEDGKCFDHVGPYDSETEAMGYVAQEP